MMQLQMLGAALDEDRHRAAFVRDRTRTQV